METVTSITVSYISDEYLMAIRKLFSISSNYLKSLTNCDMQGTEAKAAWTNSGAVHLAK